MGKIKLDFKQANMKAHTAFFVSSLHAKALNAGENRRRILNCNSEQAQTNQRLRLFCPPAVAATPRMSIENIGSGHTGDSGGDILQIERAAKQNYERCVIGTFSVFQKSLHKCLTSAMVELNICTCFSGYSTSLKQ